MKVEKHFGIDVNVTENGCWIPLLENDQVIYEARGYRVIKFPNGKTIPVHRYFYMRHHGLNNIDRRSVVHHCCPNKKCVNPDHLQLMTDKDHGIMHNAKPLVQIDNETGDIKLWISASDAAKAQGLNQAYIGFCVADAWCEYAGSTWMRVSWDFVYRNRSMIQ